MLVFVSILEFKLQFMNSSKITHLLLLLLFSAMQIYSQPEYSWAIQGGKTSLIEGNIQVVNTGSGIITAGDFIETAQFEDQQITSNGSSDIYLTRYSEEGALEELLSFGSANEELLKFMEVDNDGNIIVSMVFTESISIDGVEYISNGGQDVLLLKFNSEFNLLWTKHYGTGLTDYVRGMGIDGDGNIVVTGKFKYELDFDDITINSAGSTDIYVVKFNPDGEVLFAFSEGADTYEDANTVAVAESGSIFLSGTFYESTIINGEPITTDNTTGLFFAKYNEDGVFQWIELIDGTNLLPYLFIVTNVDESIYIAGSFQDEVHFGSQTLNTGEFDTDVFIAKYNENGEALWAGHGDSQAGENVTGLSSDIGGNAYVTGPFLANINFNGQIIEYTLC